MKYIFRFFLFIIFILFIAVVAGFIAWWYTCDIMSSNEVIVPEVSKMRIEKAREILKEKKLDIEEIGIYNENYEIGTVVSQEPLAGEKIKQGRKIRLKISQKVLRDRMLDFTCKSLVEVKDVIRKYEADKNISNLIVLNKIIYIYDDIIPAGYVIAQSPEPRSEIPKGVNAALVVSRGKQEKDFLMPDLAGLFEEEARELLNNIGLNVKVQRKAVPDTEEGKVFAQKPGFGSFVKSGDNVVIYVYEKYKDISSRRSTIFPFVAPMDNRNHHLKVIVDDKKGVKEVYNSSIKSGRKVDISIDYYPPAKVIIYLDNKWYREERL
ncbi:MAG: PASTA domain-containing protein [Candidatus Hydrogenedentota bacterium]